MKARILTIIKFCLVGGVNTLIDYGVSLALRYLLSAPDWLATGLGYCVGTVSSYILNGRFTFKAKGKVIAFLIVNAVSLTVSILIGRLWAAVGLGSEQWYWLTKGMTICVTMVINFLGYRLFAFKAA